jgi:adenylate cyclase
MATSSTVGSFVLSLAAGTDAREIVLAEGSTVVGRAPSCDVVILDVSVSRRHACFTMAGGRCTVRDLGSSNGTFVNGAQIEEAALQHGDKLILGFVPVAVRRTAGASVVVAEGDAVPNLGRVIARPVDDRAASEAGALVDAPRLLKLLSDVSRALVATQPIDDVLGRVVDLALDWTQAKRVLLLLLDKESNALVPCVVRHCEGFEASTRLSRTIVEKAMRDRVSIMAMNAQTDPQLYTAESIVNLDIRSFMCAPLWQGNDIIGLLYVDNPMSQGFNEADLDLFTAFSNYAAVAIAQAQLASMVYQEVRRRERLERYHSPAVVDRILKGGTDADAPFIAQERDLTVLFADLAGFTSLAEQMPPQQVAVLLNVFFARMADVIFQHDGTLDKFIGDAVLAVFGAPLDLADHALHAVRAAQEMHRALARLNAERPAHPLRMRIAIHTGVAMVGDIGSPKRREYTVLGDVVNTAARIEDSAAEPGQTVISRATYDRLAGRVAARSLGLVQFRGQTKQVELFDVPTD